MITEFGGKQMYKLIACDLDETLLNDHKKICKRNLDAIAKACGEHGVKFVPATGRGYTCIDSVLAELNVIDRAEEYIISNNGGILCENREFKELSFHELPFKKAKELFAYGIEKGLCVQIFTAKDVYAYQLNEDEREWLFMFKPDAKIMEETTMDFLEHTAIAKILFERADMEYLKQVAQDMESITDGVSVSFSSNRYLELNREGVDKGLGLKELANHLGIDMKDTIAIGDNYNDVAMLKEAGLSIAMSNAPQDIKDICDYVTCANHNDGGVGEAIEKYILQECSI